MKMDDSYLSYFTPGQMTHETLEFIFVKRQKLVERLVERVRQSVLTEAKHYSLLLGPRGMGKSHLVALAYYRVKEMADLKDKVALAWLAEEEWGVASLADLFLVILKALAREYPDSTLESEIEGLYRLPYDQIEGEAARKIRDFVGDRTLFLLIENLEEIFRGLGSDGQWAFRSFLSERPFVTILATTPTLFAGIQKQEEAFYGFFQPSYLEELTVEEAVELLSKVAERREDVPLTNFLKTPVAQDRVQAVHELAGGHPRIYLLFAHLITDVTLDELVKPFLALLDELTPYYQSRMQLLAPQQRKIVEYLCIRRGAVTVKEIASGNMMSPQTAASQLGELEKMSYVRKTPVGRESYYELREPLLRMIIEMKRGRGEPLRLVVDFLRRWYSRKERNTRLQNAPSHARLTRQYLEASLDLERAVQDTPDPKRANALSPEFWAAYNKGDFARANEFAAEIIERKGRNCTAEDWFQYAYCFDELGDYSKAIESLDKALKINPEDAQAWNNRGVALGNLGRYEEARDSYDKALKINPEDAQAWYNQGVALSNLGRYEEARDSYDKALKINPEDAQAWNNRGVALRNLGRYEEALESYDKALKITPDYAWAWFNRGTALEGLGRYEESLESYDKGIKTNHEDAKAWFSRGDLLLRASRWDAFYQTMEQGFTFADDTDNWRGEMSTICHLLLQQNWPDEEAKIATLTELYANNKSLSQLGDGLTQSIPALFAPEITQERAEAWLAAWTNAGKDKPDLEVPLRLLAAAVAWKPKRDVRALLTLAIEERRILESLLPKE